MELNALHTADQEKTSLHKKGALDLTDLIPTEYVPSCYGGEMHQLPPEALALLGIDQLEEPLLSAMLPGPSKWAGKLHLPPEKALNADEEWYSRNRVSRNSRSMLVDLVRE